MPHAQHPAQSNGHTHAAPAEPAPAEILHLRQLREKCEHGDASPQERLAWFDHLLAAARARGDEDAIPFLFRLREEQATVVATATEPRLPDPADPRQYLSWLSADQLHPSPCYGQEPVDDATRTALVESIRHDGGIHDPLLVSTEHEIVHGRTRWMAWREAVTDPHRRLPVLVKAFTPSQKKRAFLATKVIGQRTAVLRTATYAHEAMTAHAAAHPAIQPDAVLPELNAPAATQVPLLAARIATLPKEQRRLLTRQLVAEDTMLQDTLLAEAERRAHSEDDTRQLRGELQRLRHTLEEVSTEQDRRQHTVDQLEEHLAQARVQRAELDTVVEELQLAKQELERGRKVVDAEVQTLRTRVQHVAPLERLAGAAQASAVAPLILDLVEVTGKKLFPTLFHYLQPASAPTVAAELTRLLDEVERLVRQCRHHLQHPPTLDRPFLDYAHTQEGEA